MFKKLFSLFAALTLSAGLWAVDWSQIGWLGNGSGIPDYMDKYKVYAKSGIQDIVNIQKPGFATKPGIYVTVPAGISDCSLGEGNFDIQGSSIILHLDAFTKQETEVTITYSGGTGVVLVYYADGGAAPAAGITVNVTVPAGTPACYFYGEMSGNAFAEMTKVDDTHYTIEFPEATTIGWGYVFVWENGNWNTANADPNGDIRVEPEDGVINIEIKAWKSAPAPPTPVVGDQFEDATSGLKFEVTAVGETNTVKVIPLGVEEYYAGTTYTVPATVLYNNVEFTVTTIGEHAFENCTSLQSVTIAQNGVKTIEGYAFSGCSSLQSVTLSIWLNTIGEFAFYNCESLESVTIPVNVTTIGERAFGGCFGLTSVTIEDIVCQDGINDYAFDGVGMNTPATLVLPIYWTGIRPDKDGKWYGGYFKFPAPNVGDKFVDETTKLLFEVTAVGDNYTAKVISDKYRGNSYIIPDTVKYNDVDFAVTEIGAGAFSNCTSLKSITIPAGVTVIRDRAFENSGLQSITLLANVTTIGQYAFLNCSSLQSIELPASVTTIGEYVFSNCEGLTSVTFKGATCTIGEDAFYGVGETAPAALTLPANWTGILPDEEGNWYSGKFELITTTLPTVKSADKVSVLKYIKNGRLEIDDNGKKYNALGF